MIQFFKFKRKSSYETITYFNTIFNTIIYRMFSKRASETSNYPYLKGKSKTAEGKEIPMDD